MSSPATNTQVRPAGRCPRAIVRLLTIAIVLLAADLIIKKLAFECVADAPITLQRETDAFRNVVPAHDAIPLVPKTLSLKLTLNRGAVFGIGQGGRWLFVGATAIAILVISVVFARSQRGAWVFHAALACILAGALGNLYDRLMFGVVRDMFWLFPGVKLPFGWTWPGGSDEVYPWIFNLADVALLAGVAIIFLSTFRAPEEKTHDHSHD